MSYQVHTKEIPAQQVIGVQRHVFVQHLPAFIEQTIAQLERYLDEHGLERTGSPAVIYHGEVNELKDGPVELFWPFAGELPADAPYRPKRFAPQEVAFTVATLRQCNYPTILEAYDAVYNWVNSRGRVRIGPPREIYIADPAHTQPDDPFVEIAWPIR